MVHFEEALKSSHASCDPASLKFYEDFARQLSRERTGRRKDEGPQGIYR